MVFYQRVRIHAGVVPAHKGRQTRTGTVEHKAYSIVYNDA